MEKLKLIILLATFGFVKTLPMPEFERPDIRNYDVIERITVDGKPNYIVGVDNALLRFDENLVLIESTATGPVCEAKYVNICPENVEKIIVNRASVIVAELQKEVLIYCGSAFYGRCSIYGWSTFGEPTLLDTNSKTSFIGSNLSAIASFQPITKSNQQLYGITVGITYDGRPQKYYPLGVSTLTLRATGGAFSLDYIRHLSEEGVRSGVSVADRYQARFLVEYIYSFVYEGFQYYLALQLRSILSSRHRTVLQRIKLDDLDYHSYVELPLECGDKKGKYNIATSGYLGKMGPDMAVKFPDANTNDPALFVAFSSSSNYRIKDMSTLKRESVICVYNLLEVVEEFKQAQINCYNDIHSRATKVPWMMDEINPDVACTPDDIIASNIQSDFSGNRLNPYIRGLTPLECREPIGIYNGLITSLSVTVRQMVGPQKTAITIGVAGTYDGVITKFHFDDFRKKPFATHTLVGGSIANNMLFDSTEDNLYVLNRMKIVKFPVSSCGVYSDCASCVTSRDKTVKCGWCQFADNPGTCTERDQCLTATWAENECKPVISSFTPLAGPTAGGTPITITGSGFGNPDLPDAVNLKVAMGTRDCVIQNHTFHTIECTTVEYSSTGSFQVSVNAVDKTTSVVPYIVEGEAKASTLFQVKHAHVNNITPRFGPQSGGTNVTLSGTHLDIGGIHSVQIGNSSCEIYSTMPEVLHCTTQAVGDEALISSRVVLNIDKASIVSPVNYTYRPDPAIIDLNRKISFLSGGLNITIRGENFDVIQQPIMQVDLNGTLFYSQCIVVSASWMVCPTPSIIHDPMNNTVGRISFIMDNVEAMRNFADNNYMGTLYYVEDPDFFSFEEILEFEIDDENLVLYGSDLDLASSVTDVIVTVGHSPCNVTSMTSSELTCTPLDKPENVDDTESLRAVIVVVGNLKFNLGYLRYIPPISNASMAVIISFFFLFLFVIVILIVLYHCYKRQLWPFKRAKMNGMVVSDRVVFTNHGRLDPVADPATRLGLNDYDMLLPQEYVDVLPSLDSSGLRVHRDQVTLLEQIGEGHFGCVWRGHLALKDSKEKTREVAIKTSRSTVANDDVKNFLDEAMLMRDFHHEHVLSLIGICLDREKGPMVILPFMHLGDLHTYICNPLNNPSVRDLMDFGLQIARGMEYLAEKKFVHRDLAARNCMLDENNIVKVADFGLARDVYEKSYYRPSPEHGIPLPVRWMAIECFEKNVFSTKTDVWAYGVVLWELMTRGIKPYPDVMENWAILSYLKKGRRLTRPQYCPPELHDIMLKCWDIEPDRRPSVSELVKEIEALLTTLERRSANRADTLYENVPIRTSY